MSNTLGATDSVHASAICAGVCPRLRRFTLYGWVAERRIVSREAKTEREERYEGDALFDTGIQHRL